MLYKNRSWLFPLLLLVAITPFASRLDLAFARAFYTDGQFMSGPFLSFMFDYAIFPAWSVAVLSLAVVVLSYVSSFWKKWHNVALLLVLSLVIGAGFVTHVLLKDHWGRPRPKQVIEFGGTQEFRPYYSPNFTHQPEPSKSFPCGHCSMGYYFFALVLVGRRLNSKTVVYAGWTLALGLGTLLGAVRMMQGGHFFSDVLVSAIIMWEVALAMEILAFDREKKKI